MSLKNDVILNETNILEKYVTFKLADDFFGIEVMKVKEVLYLVEMTQLPNTHSYMRGVFDLRGLVVPLIDLRVKFDLKEREYDEDTVILIVEIHDMLIGFIVDQVFDVLNLEIDNYHEVPHFTESIKRDSVAGIAQNNNDLIVILEVDKIFSLEDIQGFENSQNTITEQE